MHLGQGSCTFSRVTGAPVTWGRRGDCISPEKEHGMHIVSFGCIEKEKTKTEHKPGAARVIQPRSLMQTLWDERRTSFRFARRQSPLMTLGLGLMQARPRVSPLFNHAHAPSYMRMRGHCPGLGTVLKQEKQGLGFVVETLRAIQGGQDPGATTHGALLRLRWRQFSLPPAPEHMSLERRSRRERASAKLF